MNTKHSSKTSRKSAKRSTSVRVPGVSFIRSHEFIREYKLKANGLTILSVHVQNSPAVTTNIVYHVGSQHEGMRETGLAHMLEHMLFKPLAKPGITWKELEDKGALLNATTWLDRTMYYFNMPNDYFEDMLTVEANRMRHVALTDKEFQPERTNVLSEYEMYNSRPESALEWNMVGSAFTAHTYKHDTIGFRSDIENYTTEMLRDFYERHYWPDNATLIVVGDIDERAMLTSVKKVFGNIKAGERAKKVPTKEPKQEGLRRVTLERNTPIRYLQVAFKAPPLLEPDWILLHLALSYLADGKSSLLYKRLVEKGHATSVSAALYPTKDPFLASLHVYATKSASYDDIERIIFDTIAECIKKEIPREKMEGLKQYLYAEELFSRDGTFRIASSLAEYVAAGDWTRYFSVLTDIKEASPKDVRGALSRYLIKSQAIIGTIEKPAS